MSALAPSKTAVWKLAVPVAAMVAIVALSNFLVQFPVQAQLGTVNLADLFTWAAFSYPIAFLVNRSSPNFTAGKFPGIQDECVGAK